MRNTQVKLVTKAWGEVPSDATQRKNEVLKTLKSIGYRLVWPYRVPEKINLMILRPLNSEHRSKVALTCRRFYCSHYGLKLWLKLWLKS